MRIAGRVLRPSNLAERRLMLSMGVQAIRIPRHQNPYVVARRLARCARGDSEDHRFLRVLIDSEVIDSQRSEQQRCEPGFSEPQPSPGADESGSQELCAQAS